MKITIKHFNTAEEKALANEYVKAAGLQKFNSLDFQFSMIPEGVYEIDADHLFPNQYNTEGEKGLRIFEYCEKLTCYRGKVNESGRGYYIAEGIEALRAAQKARHVCGYCGKQYTAPNIPGDGFCKACLDSEYLEKKDLNLLRLLPVYPEKRGNWPELSPEEAAWLIPLYIEHQTTATGSRAAARRAQKRLDIENDYKKETLAANMKYFGFTWLMDKGVNVENCIFYDHTLKFSFGWRHPVDYETEKELLRVLDGFPYSYEIKTEAK